MPQPVYHKKDESEITQEAEQGDAKAMARVL